MLGHQNSSLQIQPLLISPSSVEQTPLADGRNERQLHSQAFKILAHKILSRVTKNLILRMKLHKTPVVRPGFIQHPKVSVAGKRKIIAAIVNRFFF